MNLTCFTNRLATAYVIDLTLSPPSWTMVAPLPSARQSPACGSAVIDGVDMVVISGGTGEDSEGNDIRLDEVLIYDPTSGDAGSYSPANGNLPRAVDFVRKHPLDLILFHLHVMIFLCSALKFLDSYQ